MNLKQLLRIVKLRWHIRYNDNMWASLLYKPELRISLRQRIARLFNWIAAIRKWIKG